MKTFSHLHNFWTITLKNIRKYKQTKLSIWLLTTYHLLYCMHPPEHTRSTKGEVISVLSAAAIEMALLKVQDCLELVLPPVNIQL